MDESPAGVIDGVLERVYVLVEREEVAVISQFLQYRTAVPSSSESDIHIGAFGLDVQTLNRFR